MSASQKELLAHELLHGAYLVVELLEKVGLSGDASWDPNKEDEASLCHFNKNPKLKEKYDKAMEAVLGFYQAAG